MAVKYIFVTGGVVSGLGKGITAASLGRLLKARGYKVTMQKFDPYINIDPGTMNPVQHGEVFVTEDGTETDLDLGHYERDSLTRIWIKIQTLLPVRFTGLFFRRSVAAIMADAPYRLSLTLQTRSRASSTGTSQTTRPASLLSKLAEQSEISSLSHSLRLSDSSSTKLDMRTQCSSLFL